MCVYLLLRDMCACISLRSRYTFVRTGDKPTKVSKLTGITFDGFTAAGDYVAAVSRDGDVDFIEGTDANRSGSVKSDKLGCVHDLFISDIISAFSLPLPTCFMAGSFFCEHVHAWHLRVAFLFVFQFIEGIFTLVIQWFHMPVPLQPHTSCRQCSKCISNVFWQIARHCNRRLGSRARMGHERCWTNWSWAHRRRRAKRSSKTVANENQGSNYGLLLSLPPQSLAIN